MKVVLTQTEGAPHFALLDDLEVEGLRIVQVSTPEELATEIRDADVLYGFPTADGFSLPARGSTICRI
jgi:hypothetical protein